MVPIAPAGMAVCAKASVFPTRSHFLREFLDGITSRVLSIETRANVALAPLKPTCIGHRVSGYSVTSGAASLALRQDIDMHNYSAVVATHVVIRKTAQIRVMKTFCSLDVLLNEVD